MNSRELNMNYPEILLLRMIRTKSELGGDGVSHHRSTFDRASTTNDGAARAEPSLLELCRVVTEEDRRSNRLPVPALSYVRFRVRNRPPRSYFIRLIRVFVKRMLFVLFVLSSKIINE